MGEHGDPINRSAVVTETLDSGPTELRVLEVGESPSGRIPRLARSLSDQTNLRRERRRAKSGLPSRGGPARPQRACEATRTPEGARASKPPVRTGGGAVDLPTGMARPGARCDWGAAGCATRSEDGQVPECTSPQVLCGSNAAGSAHEGARLATRAGETDARRGCPSPVLLGLGVTDRGWRSGRRGIRRRTGSTGRAVEEFAADHAQVEPGRLERQRYERGLGHPGGDVDLEEPRDPVGVDDQVGT